MRLSLPPLVRSSHPGQNGGQEKNGNVLPQLSAMAPGGLVPPCVSASPCFSHLQGLQLPSVGEPGGTALGAQCSSIWRMQFYF